MRDGQLENTGVCMVVANSDAMTKRQLVNLMRSTQGPNVILDGNDLDKVRQAQEEANKLDTSMCKDIFRLARAYDVHAVDVGGSRTALWFNAHRPDYKKKRAQREYMWTWLKSDGGAGVSSVVHLHGRVQGKGGRVQSASIRRRLA